MAWSDNARIEPQDRKAGPDTDDAIAVHVMEWFWQYDHNGNMAWWAPTEPHETLWGEGTGRTMFTPSVDIAHAWIVLEQFTWPQFYTRLVRTERGNWRCDIDLNGGDGPVRSAWAETAPLAICRAALAAVGV